MKIVRKGGVFVLNMEGKSFKDYYYIRVDLGDFGTREVFMKGYADSDITYNMEGNSMLSGYDILLSLDPIVRRSAFIFKTGDSYYVINLSLVKDMCDMGETFRVCFKSGLRLNMQGVSNGAKTRFSPSVMFYRLYENGEILVSNNKGWSIPLKDVDFMRRCSDGTVICKFGKDDEVTSKKFSIVINDTSYSLDDYFKLSNLLIRANSSRGVFFVNSDNAHIDNEVGKYILKCKSSSYDIGKLYEVEGKVLGSYEDGFLGVVEL